MASLKRIHESKRTPASTTDGTTWVTIATYTLSDNSAFTIDAWAVGKDGSLNVASLKGLHSGKRASGTITLASGVTFLIAALSILEAALSVATFRININGNDLELQAKGVALTTIEWIGSFKIIIH